MEPGDVIAYDGHPSETVVGDRLARTAAAGLTEGQLQYSDEAARFMPARAGAGLMREERFAGFSHATDGTLQAYIDGIPAGAPESRAYQGADIGWSTIGAGRNHTANSHYGGTLGAVIVLPTSVELETVARIHAWAQGRFGAP